MAGQGFHCNEGTISIGHKIKAIPSGSGPIPSEDHAFRWKISSAAQYEDKWFSTIFSSRQSITGNQQGSTNFKLTIDLPAGNVDKVQRPALYIFYSRHNK